MRPTACYRQLAVRRRRICGDDGVEDAGNALIEFIFIAVLILIPLVYFVVAIASVQRSTVAVTHAAREAGRAFATADSTDQGVQRAEAAVRPHWPIKVFPTMRLCATSRRMGPASLGRPRCFKPRAHRRCVIRHASLPAVPSLISFVESRQLVVTCSTSMTIGRGAMNVGVRLADDRLDDSADSRLFRGRVSDQAAASRAMHSCSSATTEATCVAAAAATSADLAAARETGDARICLTSGKCAGGRRPVQVRDASRSAGRRGDLSQDAETVSLACVEMY